MPHQLHYVQSYAGKINITQFTYAEQQTVCGNTAASICQ